jgi:hypothetical protein
MKTLKLVVSVAVLSLVGCGVGAEDTASDNSSGSVKQEVTTCYAKGTVVNSLLRLNCCSGSKQGPGIYYTCL